MVDVLNAINDKLLDSLSMFLFENKSDLIALRGQSILAKIDSKELKFEFKVE